MDEKILKKIIKNKEKFIPLIFTNKQIQILEMYLNKKQLSNTEKTYFYSTIKKKIDALKTLSEEYFISGEDMIDKRIKLSKDILKDLNKKAFISGSFLYSNKFNDIDIYIISNKRKHYHKENKHFIFITEEDLKKPLFISALKYSVSNFSIEPKTPEIKRPFFNDLIITYEMAINEILEKEDQKSIREIIFEYYLQIEKTILHSYSLYKKTDEILKLNKGKQIETINRMTKEILTKCYSHKYLYNELTPFLKQLKKDISKLKTNDNFIIYYDLLGEVKSGCRRAKT